MIYMIVTMRWGMGLGAKNQNDADVCALAEILKEEDDDEDDASEKEEEKRNIYINATDEGEKNDDNETKATDEIVKKISLNFSNIKIFYTFRLPPPVSI